MAVGYNPRAITDGLVLALDAGNPKNYNVGISTNWVDKVGGNNGTLVNGTYHNDGPFVGAGYVDFNSSGDYLSIADSADLELDTNTTIELFIKFNTIPTVATYIFGKTNGYWLAYDSTAVGGVADRFTFAIYDGSSWSGATNASGGFLPVVNTWYHIAVVKEGTSTKLYVDGTLYGSGTFSGTPADNSNVVSINYSGGTIDADISNVRFIRGTALYTSNFTPPTKSLTAVTNTKLLTCQGNTIADASSSAHTITANGGISPTKEPFAGAGSVAFDGSGDYLSLASTTCYLGANDFTVEAWVYWEGNTALSSIPAIISKWSSTGGPFQFLVNASGFSFQYTKAAGGQLTAAGTTAPSAKTWYHVAAVKYGSELKLYVDGVVEATTTGATAILNRNDNVQIGHRTWAGPPPAAWDGYISNLRLVSTALYTAAFTPPSRTLEPIENTVLLTCQGQNIKDASSNAHAITVNGDAKATIVSSSFEFDGTDDYVDCGTSTDFDFGTGNYTIEAWIYINDGVQQYHGIFGSSGTGSDSLQFQLQDEKIRLSSYTAEILVSDAADVVSFRQWTHVVISRSGTGATDTKLYKNGSLIKSGQDNINWGSYSRQIGRVFSNNAYDLYGKIAQVKVYKGKGLTAAEVEQNYNATKGRYA